MDFTEAGQTLKKENFNDYIKERLLTIYHENIFTSLLFDCLVLVS